MASKEEKDYVTITSGECPECGATDSLTELSVHDVNIMTCCKCITGFKVDPLTKTCSK